MAARQIPRKRRRGTLPRRNLQKKQRTTPAPSDSFTNNRVTSCSHEHPYATRSKSLLEVSTAKLENLSSQSSSSSIIFLGTFQKTPQLITLDDSDDEQSEDAVKHSEKRKASKEKEVIVSQSSMESLINKFFMCANKCKK